MTPEDLLPLIRSLECELHETSVRQNVARLNELLHPEFLELGRSGRSYTKADILELLPVSGSSVQVLARDFALRVLGPDAVVLTYTSAQVRETGSLESHALRSSIWQRGPAGWQMSFHQGTPTGLSRDHSAGGESMTRDPLVTWHQVVQNRDLKSLDALLSDQVVFHSPVVHTPQRGKVVTTQYLAAAFRVFFNESFHYVREVASGHDAVLEFQVEIDGISVNGVDMIAWNDAGQIVDFKVMIRPLKAINLIHQKMAAMLQASS